jgi:hypothetical protein
MGQYSVSKEGKSNAFILFFVPLPGRCKIHRSVVFFSSFFRLSGHLKHPSPNQALVWDAPDVAPHSLSVKSQN